jgi:sulfur-carrier protein
MEIELRMFATFRRYLPPGSEGHVCMLQINPGATISSVLGRLGLPPEGPRIVLKNGLHARDDAELKEGDVLSLFPPLGGG